MSEDGTRDLAWWRIPQWVPMGPRVVVTGIVAGLVIGLVFELAFGLTFGLPYGLGWGLVLGLRSGPGRGTLKSIGRLRWRALITGDALVFGLIFGLAAGLISVLAFGLMVGAVFGLIFGLMVGLGSRLGSALEQPGWEETTPRDPLTSWQRDRDFGLMVGLAYGLPAGFVFGFVFGLVSGLVSGLAVELVLGVMGSQTWPTTLACTQLRISRHTPLRMIRFLEDARSRQVLRTVGPIYQFRHARLQDRLAGATPIRHA